MFALVANRTLTKDEIPSRTSIERMAIEMGVLSDIQSAEFLYRTTGVTIAFDSTTQEGVHVNVISIHKGEEEYMIALNELPGGTAVDYSEHVFMTIDHLAKLYSALKDLPENEVS